MKDSIGIILAGGLGSRMGNLFTVLPKCLLPVSKDDTLLTHVMNHLIRMNLDTIIVSTSEANFDIIRTFVTSLRNIKKKVDLIVFKNQGHVDGPVAALQKVVSTWEKKSYILSLSDIVFLDKLLIMPPPNRNWLLCSPRITGRSGVVATMGMFAKHLYYNSTEAPHEERMNWTGTACFDRRVADILINLSNPSNFTNLEEFINSSIEFGNDWQIVMTSNFVNVNTFQDYLNQISCCPINTNLNCRINGPTSNN